MTVETKIVTGNTYPVKDKLKDMGGKWNPIQKGWDVPSDRYDDAVALVKSAPRPSYHPTACKVCGQGASRYTRIYRNGICSDCYKDYKDGDWS